MNKLWDWPMTVDIMHKSGMGVVEFKRWAFRLGLPYDYKDHIFMTTPLTGDNPNEYVTLRCLDEPGLSVQGSVRRSMLKKARKKTIRKCNERLDRRMDEYMEKHLPLAAQRLKETRSMK